MIDNNKIIRLNQLIKETGLSQAAFANKLGTKQQTISEMIKGKRPIGKNVTKNLIFTFGVNPEWFETGEGEMFSGIKTEKTDEETVTVPKSVLDTITSQQRTIDRLTEMLERQISDAKGLENQPEVHKKTAVFQEGTCRCA